MHVGLFSSADSSLHCHTVQGQRTKKTDALSRIHDTEPHSFSEEHILSPACIVGSVQWELAQEISKTPQNQIPASCPPNKHFVPLHLCDRFIIWGHTSVATGHPGNHRTYQLLKEKYWWTNMLSDICCVVSSCSTCAQAKVPRTLPTGKLLPLPTPQHPWSQLSVGRVSSRQG